jgi:preprotein translocase subunit SecF
VTGTYSSVFVATPLIVDWDAWSQARDKARRGKKSVAKATAGSVHPPRR